MCDVVDDDGMYAGKKSIDVVRTYISAHLLFDRSYLLNYSELSIITFAVGWKSGWSDLAVNWKVVTSLCRKVRILVYVVLCQLILLIRGTQ